MLDQLVDLGVKENKLDRVIARSPQLLLRKSKNFLQVFLFFLQLHVICMLLFFSFISC
ncbi:hypothetical protein AHAS_Ahas19G0228700 [Arachis hypogaea]